MDARRARDIIDHHHQSHAVDKGEPVFDGSRASGRKGAIEVFETVNSPDSRRYDFVDMLCFGLVILGEFFESWKAGKWALPRSYGDRLCAALNDTRFKAFDELSNMDRRATADGFAGAYALVVAMSASPAARTKFHKGELAISDHKMRIFRNALHNVMLQDEIDSMTEAMRYLDAVDAAALSA